MSNHNHVDPDNVIEIGEDGEVWLVKNCDRRIIAEASIIRFLAKAHEGDEELIGAYVLNIIESTSTFGNFYFHDDGVHDPVLRRTFYSHVGTHVFRGILIYSGIKLPPIDTRPLPPGEAVIDGE